jgi:hypothetical protein
MEITGKRETRWPVDASLGDVASDWRWKTRRD